MDNAKGITSDLGSWRLESLPSVQELIVPSHQVSLKKDQPLIIFLCLNVDSLEVYSSYCSVTLFDGIWSGDFSLLG